MRCGGPADVSRQQRVSYHSPVLCAVILMGFPGLLLYLILMVVVSKRFTISVPLCRRHQHYWLHHRRTFHYALVVFTLMAFIGLTTFLLLMHGTDAVDVGTEFCMGNVSLVMACLMALGAWEKSGMRVLEITARSITVADVSQDFIDAVRRDRRGDISLEDDEGDR
jgi:hypothetical protein